MRQASRACRRRSTPSAQCVGASLLRKKDNDSQRHFGRGFSSCSLRRFSRSALWPHSLSERTHTPSPTFVVCGRRPTRTLRRLRLASMSGAQTDCDPARTLDSCQPPEQSSNQGTPSADKSSRTWVAGTPRLDPPYSGRIAALTATTAPFTSSTGPPLPPSVVSAS